MTEYGSYQHARRAPQGSTFARAKSAIGRGLKAFAMVFQRNVFRAFALPRSRVDYLAQVGDGTGSSTVTAPLFWVARTFPEAPPMLWRKLDNGQREKVFDHPLLAQLEQPNVFYTGMTLWMATVIDYQVDGNAYWLKLRNQAGAVGALWWIPHWLICPRGSDTDDRVFIDHYEYTPGAELFKLPPNDVVHFRFGLDPNDPRLGRSPLKSVLREVFTDDEASAFTASLLSNMGVPGLMVTPEKGVTVSEEDAKEAKSDLMSLFTGDRRGEPIVMTSATKIEQFGFSPEQLMLRELRRIPEERVTAVLGVPAIVAGLGAGLDRSTFTNMGEAREAAYEAGIIPMQRNLAETIRFSLLPEFEPDPTVWRFGFDLDDVRVLREDALREARRVDLLWRGGEITRAEARRSLGLPVDEDRDNVFLVAKNMTLIGPDGPEAIPSGTNGSGDLAALEAALT